MSKAAAGFLDLTMGDPVAAADATRPIVGFVEGMDICPPVLAFFVPEAIEALAAVGSTQRAEVLIESLVRAGEATGRPNLTAVAGRCRAMVLAARGDLDAAVVAAGAALAAGGAAIPPFDARRTLLLKGQLYRRVRQKRRAREALTDAIDVFAQIDAVLWERMARDELDRLGLRTPGGELSATEHRVAALVATGLTNREIAARSFLSPKTVEAHIARVYRKLGIRSRAELGAWMRDHDGKT